jgi:GPI mannosyltransferase 3
VDETTRLRRSLLLAALATVLRPTNVLIWICVAATTCLKMSSGGWFARMPWIDQRVLIEFTFPSFLRAITRERTKLITESVLCGSTVLILSLLVDRWFYQFWTFPPLKFLYFNVVQSLSIFYGRNDWHYYLSQGFPLLLTTALPFAVAGLYRGLVFTDSAKSPLTDTILSQLATTSCAVPAALSLISHKEVRFIYPLVPLLHVLAAEPLTQFFAPSLVHPLRSRRTPPYALLRRLILGLLILVNASIGLYITTVHGRGVIDILTYLRHQHETYYMPHHTSNLTAAFLMPCHSTPWRSHLVHNNISAWALTCEPPLHLSPEEKTTYLDEADVFYTDPLLWMRHNMSRQPPRPRGGIFLRDKQQRLDPHGRRKPDPQGHVDKRREWPDYLIFFAQAEKTMDVALRGSGYAECWRGFNSHWHDDWRRKGDVVAWCVFPERRVREDEERAARARQRVRVWLGMVGRMRGWVADGKRVFGFGKTDQQRSEKHASGKVPAISISRDRADSVLGGAKGPWGVGKSRPEKKEPPTRWWEMSSWGGQRQPTTKKKKKQQQNAWS